MRSTASKTSLSSGLPSSTSLCCCSCGRYLGGSAGSAAASSNWLLHASACTAPVEVSPREAKHAASTGRVMDGNNSEDQSCTQARRASPTCCHRRGASWTRTPTARSQSAGAARQQAAAPPAERLRGCSAIRGAAACKAGQGSPGRASCSSSRESMFHVRFCLPESAGGNVWGCMHQHSRQQALQARHLQQQQGLQIRLCQGPSSLCDPGQQGLGHTGEHDGSACADGVLRKQLGPAAAERLL
jgi:hypothetical protein